MVEVTDLTGHRWPVFYLPVESHCGWTRSYFKTWIFHRLFCYFGNVLWDFEADCEIQFDFFVWHLGRFWHFRCRFQQKFEVFLSVFKLLYCINNFVSIFIAQNWHMCRERGSQFIVGNKLCSIADEKCIRNRTWQSSMKIDIIVLLRPTQPDKKLLTRLVVSTFDFQLQTRINVRKGFTSLV